jgi:DNA polymerase III delta prime subunit
MNDEAKLSESHHDILEKWKQVVEKTPSSSRFKLDREYRPSEATKRAENFISNPSESAFSRLWKPLHSAQRAGAASKIYEKWKNDGRTDDELAVVIREIHESESYNSDWEDELGAQKTVWELFGFLHIDDCPIINSCAQTGLEFFGYDCPDNYEGNAEVFNEFRDNYESVVGHATAGTDYEVPINFEIDQLFNIIDKLKESNINDDIDKNVNQLYQLVLDSRDAGNGEIKSYDSITSATDDVLTKINHHLNGDILATELAADTIEDWSNALAGIEPGVTINEKQAKQCSQIVEVYEQLSNELSSLAEQHAIGGINRVSPAETVFLALGRDLQSQTDARVNFNQVKWGVIRDEDYELEESGSIAPADNPPAEKENIATQLEQKGQLVFYGPPGTGKTYSAQQFARWWIHSRTAGEPRAEQLELTTFHPSFSYEDFIEGLTAKEQGGAVEYVIEPGVFKEICKRAEDAYTSTPDGDTSPPYVLIVDEINRGNLAQIFGELMTLLENDKRLDAANEARSSLAHSNEPFVVPQNLYIIGTMNTADESIALLDAALRRRFRFYAFPPEFKKVTSEYNITDSEAVIRQGGSRRDQLVAASILGLEKLNSRIRNINQLGKGKQIGHTHLFGHNTGSTVRDAWRFDILPQLEDYYFGKFDRMKEELFNNASVGLFNWESEQIENFSSEILYDILCEIGGVNEPAPLEPSANDEGNQNSLDGPVGDAWDTGERTPATFKKRIENDTEAPLRERLIKLWELGDDLGELDAGRGDKTASVNVKLPDLDSGVGFYLIKDNGRFGFRWDWLCGREENEFDKNDLISIQPLFDSLNIYQIEVSEVEDEESDIDVEDPAIDLESITDEEFENLVSVIEEVHEYIASEATNV